MPLTAAKVANARSESQILRELVPYLRPFMTRILLALALVVAGKVAGLAVPLVLKKLVDALEEQDDVQAVFGNFDLPDEADEE